MEAKTPLENLRSAFDPRSIQGKILWACTVFIVIIFSFTVLVYIETRNISKVTDKLVHLHQPAIAEILKIQAGVANAAQAQRGFFLTHTQSFREERLRVWQEEVNSSFEKLSLLANDMPTEQQESIKRLGRMIDDYQRTQETLEQYFVSNVGIQDSISQEEGSKSTVNSEEVQYYLKRYYLEVINPKQAEIKSFLSPLLANLQQNSENDINIIQTNSNRFYITMLAIFILALVLTFALGYAAVIKLKELLWLPTEQLEKLAQGELPSPLRPSRNEFNPIILASNKLRENIERASNFISAIGEGKFDYQYSPVSNQDVMGNKLLQMSQKIRHVTEEDRKRNWVTTGLAQFMEVLKEDREEFRNLADRLLTRLIKYLEANQGGLYLLNTNEESQYLELIAAYAYDRKKFVDKKIVVEKEFGEGLVGQVFLEKQAMYLKKVPNGYVRLTSGLGDANPSTVLIVPLKNDESVEGVIELASFKEFEPHEIELVEKLAANIASALVNAKKASTMKDLLQITQEKSEQLQSQEEELRQNLEELEATQEEMRRKQKEMEMTKEEMERRMRDLGDDSANIKIKSEILRNAQGIFYAREVNDFWTMNHLVGAVTPLTGHSPQTFLNQEMSFLSLIHPDDRDKVENTLRNKFLVIKGGIDYALKYRLVNKNGRIRYVMDKGRTVESSIGTVMAEGFITDITELRPRGEVV
jgi:CHASE3 domain sensor protein/putative methionine-R-sulfoxide reductase with GAF domain